MGDSDAHSSGEHDRRGVLRLAAKLDLRASVELTEDLRRRRGADLRLDASAVQQLGAHAVQTLLVAVHTWTGDGHRLVCEDLPEAATAQLAVLGLEPSQLCSRATA